MLSLAVQWERGRLNHAQDFHRGRCVFYVRPHPGFYFMLYQTAGQSVTTTICCFRKNNSFICVVVFWFQTNQQKSSFHKFFILFWGFFWMIRQLEVNTAHYSLKMYSLWYKNPFRSWQSTSLWRKTFVKCHFRIINTNSNTRRLQGVV